MNMMLIKTYLGKLVPLSRIIEAVNGKIAVEIFKSSEKIDLIFMDVQKPEMDIKSKSPKKLRINLAYLSEAVRVMCFLRLSVWFESISKLNLADTHVLLIYYKHIVLEWEELKGNIEEEMDALSKER